MTQKDCINCKKNKYCELIKNFLFDSNGKHNPPHFLFINANCVKCKLWRGE